MSFISPAQLRRLQVVYAQFARRSIGIGSSREARLEWATAELGRKVYSYSTLTMDEATKLIDLCQGALGISPSKKARERTKPRRIRDEARAHAAGTEGRHDGTAGVRTLASKQDLDRIQNALDRLGWSREQFDAWLASNRSPLARKVGGVRVAPVSPSLKTFRDTNRVWWALKAMLKNRGLWHTT